MKKLLILAASLALIGAGCAAQTTVTAPSAEGTGSVQAQPSPAEGSNGAAPSPSNAMPVIGGSENIGAEGQIEFHAGTSVSITAGGTFSPAVVTVKVGDTVTWTNEGDSSAWVASDPHPVHTGYLGFDAKAPIGPGGTYSFTFEKAGSWNYHNHLHPEAKGTVIVTE